MTSVTNHPDGATILANETPLGPYPRVLTERLVQGATAHPDRLFLAERQGDDWRRVTWAEAWIAVQAIGQALIDHGVGAERPLVLLSPGSVDHALLALAATHVGAVYAPVSPAYATQDQSGDKLAHVLDLLTPGLVWAEDISALPIAIAALAERGIATLSSAAGDVARMRETPVSDAVEQAHAAIAPDDIRSFIFTSGTSGRPKAVINTHRMACANQQMFLQAFPRFAETPPELLSWLPWHHTSGANSILGSVVYTGGTLWIDDGRPTPGRGMAATVRNLAELSPTAYFSAPAGFRLLAQALRDDPDLRATFLKRLAFFFYSGASLPGPVAQELDAVTSMDGGDPVPFHSCYGATETAPFTIALNRTDTTPGLVGLPMPGVTVKLAPSDGLTEVRAKGDCVTPGYWRNPQATAEAFDDDGFYRYGDALRLADPHDPSRGLVFDGRFGENFKLATGTWVNAAGLRERILAASGALLSDVVVAGEGRDSVGALLFPTPDALADGAPALRDRIAPILTGLAQAGTGSSTFAAQALILTTPPDPTQGEVTDKGSVSARTILTTRAAAVERLFTGDPDDTLWRHDAGAGQGPRTQPLDSHSVKT